MICPKCQGKNPDNAQYCRHCGFKLFDRQKVTVLVCPNCGQVNPLDQQTCQNCHHPLQVADHQEVMTKVPLTYQAPRTSKRAKALVAILVAVFLLATGIGLVVSHNYQNPQLEYLMIKHYDQEHHYQGKTYVAFVTDRQFASGDGQHRRVYRGVLYRSFDDLQATNHQQILRRYQREPDQRVDIDIANLYRNRLTAIKYRGTAFHWVPVHYRQNHKSFVLKRHGQTTYIDVYQMS